jgi:hypothetical protein
MSRKNFRVQAVGNRWQVVDEGTDGDRFAWLRPKARTLSTHLRREDAIRAGEEAAQANLPSQLFITSSDGTTEVERRYGADG